MAVTLLLLVPLLTAVALLALPASVDGGRDGLTGAGRGVGLAALVATAVTALLAVVVVAGSMSVDLPWIRALGVRWHFAVDGLSAALVLLTALLTVAVVVHALAGRTPPGGSRATYLGCIVLVETGALATFLARDALLFFVAFEIVLVPMWVLVRRFGDEHVPDERRADAAGRFVLFTAFGSTLMLVGVLVLVNAAGTSDLDALAARAGALESGTQLTAAALLLAGLAVKVPVWPLHTWLPSAHTIAPTAGSVLLAAVLLKMGTYGIVRLPVASAPDGVATLSPALALLGVAGILWGGLACLVERDLKRLVAYSSVAHMGFVVLAVASGSETGLQAALFGNIAHGIVSALLFLVVGDLKERWGSADLGTARAALRDKAPRLGLALVVGLAAALGLPGLVTFWGEWLALYAAWSPAPDRPVGLLRSCVVAGAVGLALAAAYSLRVARIVWAGEGGDAAEGDAAEPVPDSRGWQWGVLVTLLVATVGLGVAPHLLLGISAQDVTTLLGVGR
ncbi:complex I subunit 4 family protein [Terracoccus luteus]|uniref:NADH dehydrogenase subunit M n=1 Tax=Terracoccus luteus TaxID=53356 RepID=A0A495Y1N7_9MICO|nr:NADH-quinone oxidoreductase subunit M [Terracoccus luteus]MBB2986083.1 NADH-quinone oxidoreductase subunit M [Terracoccus luteus]MCP2171735.1 NADH-quinone oxidoreductase subunit M [Terracoccus luteus]RKT78846.1 NADH dehydrogenase subunit M [Terracoccus luteus]